MVVYVEFVLYVEKYQSNPDKEKNKRNMKSEKCYEWPYLEKDYQFEFDRKTRVLHFFMKNFLASYWFVFILNVFSSLIPATVHQIDSCQNYLNNYEIQSLIADQIENGSSHVLWKPEIAGGNEEVEDEMEQYCCENYEHGSSCKSIWESHLW